MSNMIPQIHDEQEEEGWMKKFKVITRFLSILVVSCLLSLSVLSVSVIWVKNNVHAVPVIQPFERD
ncbi:hypothetical protein FY526_24660 [Clostridioides difficile]|nr:hypothetical protein FY526_24660 [Clostridioides difficile]PJN52365.1 hypothetical protein PAEAM_47700 [Paenibacillus sp. GM1FR]